MTIREKNLDSEKCPKISKLIFQSSLQKLFYFHNCRPRVHQNMHCIPTFIPVMKVSIFPAVLFSSMTKINQILPEFKVCWLHKEPTNMWSLTKPLRWVKFCVSLHNNPWIQIVKDQHLLLQYVIKFIFFKQHFKDVQYHCAYVLVFMFAGPVRMGMCDFSSIRYAQGKLTHI